MRYVQSTHSSVYKQNLTHGHVVAARDADGDSDHHLADLDGGDIVGLAEADLHAGETVVQVHECWTAAAAAAAAERRKEGKKEQQKYNEKYRYVSDCCL